MTELGSGQAPVMRELTPSGSLLAAAGAAMLAVSVFLPWYALTLTANGVAAAQQGLNQAAQLFGNANRGRLRRVPVLG
jgi:hypothetical protein